MKTRLIIALIVAVLVVVLAGCNAPTPNLSDFTTIPDPEAAQATQKRLLDKPMFDVAKVSVARLKIDGHLVQVTSLVPVFFRGYQPVSRGFKLNNEQSFTFLTFNKNHSHLTIFTRDFEKQEAYKIEVPVVAIESEKSYVFPFAHGGGRVNQAEFVFTGLQSR